jgi:hypothetical protein
MKTHFIVKTASTGMPSSCWGKYGKVAVLEVEREYEDVSMISTHAKGCVNVIQVWDRLNIGTTKRCAFWKAYEKAETLANKLNRKN